jgi:hypothetical protein
VFKSASAFQTSVTNYDNSKYGDNNENDFWETLYKVRTLSNIHSLKGVKFEGVVREAIKRELDWEE